MTSAAFGLRTSGLESLLPHWREIDSQIVDEAEALCLHGDWDPAQQRLNKYPTLLPWLAALGPAPQVAGEGAELEEHLAAASALTRRMRWIVLALSIGAVPGTWLLARRFLPDGWALAAAAFLATSLLHFEYSFVARPHGAITTWMLVCVMASMRLRRDPSRTSYALAGLALGLAMGCLHSGVAMLLPLAYAHLARDRRVSGGRWRIALALAIAGVAVVFFYWNLFEGLRARPHYAPRGALLRQGRHYIEPSMFDGSGFGDVLGRLAGGDPVLGALALLGLLGLAVELRRAGRWLPASPDAGVVLAAAVPYFLVLGSYSRSYPRLMLPLYPYLAVLAAFGLRAVARMCARIAGGGHAVRAATVIGVLAVPAAVCAKAAWLRLRPDTLEEAAAWIQEELAGSGASVALAAGLEVPLLYPRAALYHADGAPIGSGDWPRYQLELLDEARDALAAPIVRLSFSDLAAELQTGAPDARGLLLRADAEYVLCADSLQRRGRKDGRVFFDGVEALYELEARFLPDERDGAAIRYLAHDWVPQKARRVLAARALGPALSLYRRRDCELGTAQGD